MKKYMISKCKKILMVELGSGYTSDHYKIIPTLLCVWKFANLLGMGGVRDEDFPSHAHWASEMFLGTVKALHLGIQLRYESSAWRCLAMWPSSNNLGLWGIAEVGKVQREIDYGVEGRGPILLPINSRKEYVAWGWEGMKSVVASPLDAQWEAKSLGFRAPVFSALPPFLGVLWDGVPCPWRGFLTAAVLSLLPVLPSLFFFL